MKRLLGFILALALAPASAQSPQIRQLLLNQMPVAAAAGGGAQSFITASSGAQYLTTTWSHAPTEVKKATIAYWQKFTITPTTTNNYTFSTNTSGGVFFDHKYNASSLHYLVSDDVGSVYNLGDNTGFTPGTTNWHHVCIQIDTTAGTPVHIWVDGVDAGTTGTQPALNSNMQVTANTIASYIGTVSYNLATVSDAKFAYFYLIDGQALTPSSFRDGSGHPITYVGTYGANGVFLNGNGGTSGSVPDQSGNNNHFTAPNNITFSADLPT